MILASKSHTICQIPKSLYYPYSILQLFVNQVRPLIALSNLIGEFSFIFWGGGGNRWKVAKFILYFTLHSKFLILSIRALCLLNHFNLNLLPIFVTRGVHGSGWVELRGFFDPTRHDKLKKIQPNPTHHISPTQPIWVGLGRVEPMGWIIFLLLLLLNWAEKNITLATWVDKQNIH